MTRRGFVQAGLAAPMQAARPGPPGEFEYVDWSWERWRGITREERPRVDGEQAGKAELVELAAKNRAGWPARRESFQRVLEAFLGPPPAARAPLRAEVLEEQRGGGFTRRKIRYESEPGERVPAYLLIPEHLKGRAPAVLCPHQTTQAGKDSPAGLADVPQQHTAARLARRGAPVASFPSANAAGVTEADIAALLRPYRGRIRYADA